MPNDYVSPYITYNSNPIGIGMMFSVGLLIIIVILLFVYNPFGAKSTFTGNDISKYSEYKLLQSLPYSPYRTLTK